jgi:hypothetical protein
MNSMLHHYADAWSLLWKELAVVDDLGISQLLDEIIVSMRDDNGR